MEAVTAVAIGIERQLELRGVHEDGRTLDTLGTGLQYGYNLYAKLCDETQPRSDVRYAYGLRIIGLARQQQLLSFPLPGDLAQLFDRCVSKIHLQLDATIDATIHTGTGFSGSSQIISHAKERVSNADIVVKNNGQGFLGHTLALQSEHLSLSFDANDATIQPPFPHVTASPAGASGTFQIDFMSLQAVTRVRCDKNRRFVVEHTVTLNVFGPGMWDDHTPATIAVDGVPEEQLPLADAAESWDNTYPKGDNVANPIVVPLDETPVAPTAAGPCTITGVAECASFTYTAHFVGRALPG
jgi:hypothetical protein